MRAFLLLLSLPFVLGVSASAEFCGYYTRVESGEPFEAYSRTGSEADIVIRDIGPQGGRFVFWRGSSYLPYYEAAGGRWYVPELTARAGDGPRERPDNVNTYAVARIIESGADKVVVHWRYLPRFEGRNPHVNAVNRSRQVEGGGGAEPAHLVDAARFVDEYFTVWSDGRVRRTFKAGSDKYSEWIAPGNHTVQELRLGEEGVRVERTEVPEPPLAAGPVAGSPVMDRVVVAPVRWWRFDEGAGDRTEECVSGVWGAIEGPMSYWKRGVSGTALAFDGYRSVVRLGEDKAPEVGAAVTVEGWVALGAYPWNWTPVVQQGHEESYALLMGPHGSVAMVVRSGGQLCRAESKPQLLTKRWYHVAGTYDKAEGVVRVFIDGQLSGEAAAPKNGIDRSGSPVQIGKGVAMGQSDPVRFADPHDFSFDGLMDEVRIYDVALSAEQVAASCALVGAARGEPDLARRVLPVGLKTGRFGAYYTHLPFYDTWEGMFRFSDHPDVVVEFDRHPTQFVFWRGTGFIPMLVNERGGWYSNEFNETWNRSGGKGCQEPMSDKEAFSNHVKILENTPARTVVQWRFPLVDVFHTIANYDEATGWGDWSDWTYTIYPDGVAAKNMRLWSSGPINHEWQESMVITGPDQHPEQVVETDPALELATLSGEVRRYSWKDGPPRDVDYRDAKVHVIHFKGEYDPFTIGDFERGDVYGGELTDYSVFPSWNHWPVAQMPSDGRYARHPDRTAHSSLTHVVPRVYKNVGGKRPYQERLLLEGMSKLPIEGLATLARSWLHAPGIRAVSGCTAEAYNPARREYPLRATGGGIAVTIEASEAQPLVNVCFAIKNWGNGGESVVRVNGRAPEEVRQGSFVDTDGTRTLVVWIEVAAAAATEFTIVGVGAAP